MEENQGKRIYIAVGSSRLLNIRVYYDENVVYEGMVEDAPPGNKGFKIF